jgi:hypothetical protein
LRELADKATQDAWDARRAAENRLVRLKLSPGITTTMGSTWSSRKPGGRHRGEGRRAALCEHAEGMGYSSDLIYSRINLPSPRPENLRELNIPQPDFLLCCNNICNCMIKWYENLALELNTP